MRGVIPNIKENPRNRKTPKRGRKRLFNAALHALRMRVERTFAWEDKCKRLLLRFARLQQRHYGMKLLGVHDDQPASVLRYLKLATSYLSNAMSTRLPCSSCRVFSTSRALSLPRSF